MWSKSLGCLSKAIMCVWNLCATSYLRVWRVDKRRWTMLRVMCSLSFCCPRSRRWLGADPSTPVNQTPNLWFSGSYHPRLGKFPSASTWPWGPPRWAGTFLFTFGTGSRWTPLRTLRGQEPLSGNINSLSKGIPYQTRAVLAVIWSYKSEARSVYL